MTAASGQAVIRPFRRGDAAAAARLHMAYVSEGLLPSLGEEGLRVLYEAMAESPLALVLVVEREGRVGGLLCATPDPVQLLSDILSRRFLYLVGRGLGVALRRPGELVALYRRLRARPEQAGEILWVALEPDLRGLNLGRRLVAQATHELARRGVGLVLATLPEDLAGARGMLEANDFTPRRSLSGAGRKWLVLGRTLPANTAWKPGPFSAADRWRCLLRLEMLVLLPIYLLGLIPGATLLALLARRIDDLAGLPPILPFPWNLVVFGVCLLVGGSIVAWSYTYLILEGEGGPVPPFSMHTRHLVTEGPYRLVRHPSIIGKLIGVIGLAVAVGSWVFLLVGIPLLVGWSLYWNRRGQDEYLLRTYGEEYRRYRDSTPLVVPRLGDLVRLVVGR